MMGNTCRRFTLAQQGRDLIAIQAGHLDVPENKRELVADSDIVR